MISLVKNQGGNALQILVKALVFGVLFAIIRPIVNKLFDAIFGSTEKDVE